MKYRSTRIKALTAGAPALLLLALGGPIATTTTAEPIDSTWALSGAGNWNPSLPGNWTAGVPQNAGDIARFPVSESGKTITLTAPITVGQLINPGSSASRYIKLAGASKLTFDNAGVTNLLGIPGSLLQFPLDNTDYQIPTVDCPVQLNDALTFRIWTQRDGTWNGLISGAGSLTLAGCYESNHKLIVGGTAGRNTYQGGTTIARLADEATLYGNTGNGTYFANQNNNVTASKDGAFGTGDLTLGNKARLTITSSGAVEDRIDDTASVYLNTGGLMTLDTGVTETVNKLYIEGEQQAAGVWGSSTSGAPNQSANFVGAGTLTVIKGPEAPDMLLIIK